MEHPKNGLKIAVDVVAWAEKQIANKYDEEVSDIPKLDRHRE